MRIAISLFKHSKMGFFKRFRNLVSALYNYSKQTKTNLISFYFYNLIQIPVFIIMVLSIRKISFENEELSDAGIWWFKNLNEPDPYLILPIIATVLNYVNLGVSFLKIKKCIERNNKRKRALVCKQIQIIFLSTSISTFTIYSRLASRSFYLLDSQFIICTYAIESFKETLVDE